MRQKICVGLIFLSLAISGLGLMDFPWSSGGYRGVVLLAFTSVLVLALIVTRWTTPVIAFTSVTFVITNAVYDSGWWFSHSAPRMWVYWTVFMSVFIVLEAQEAKEGKGVVGSAVAILLVMLGLLVVLLGALLWDMQGGFFGSVGTVVIPLLLTFCFLYLVPPRRGAAIEVNNLSALSNNASEPKAAQKTGEDP